MFSLFRYQELEAGCRTEVIGFVSALPGEAVSGAAEVSISCRSTVNRALQIEHIDKTFWTQIKVLANQRNDGIIGQSGRAKRIDRYRGGFGDANGIEIGTAATGEPCCHNVLGNVATA